MILLALLRTVLAAPPLTVAVIGDFGTPEPGADAVAALVTSWAPDLVITVGDNNYPNGDASTIDANIGKRYHAFIHPYVGEYGQGAAENKFFPALGNHDWRDESIIPYTQYFTLPGNERYYDVAKGLLHVFVVDSDPHEPDGNKVTSVQAQWLQAGLKSAREPYRFVVLHHPPYSSGAHGSTQDLQWPYASWGASVVLAGHDHTYERVMRDGLIYVVNGLGGRDPYPFKPATVTGSAIRYNEKLGAQRITIDETAAVFEFITVDGEVVDRFTLSPTPRK